jgi:opacity protein-like surface antigen
MRKHVITGVMVVILGVMLAVVPASGEDGAYVVLKGGYFAATGEDFQGENMEGNTYWELAGGYDFLRFFGVELGVGYLQAQNSEIDTYAVPILLSGKVQFPILFFVPYLKAGVGPVYFDGSLRSGQGSDTTWTWGYQGGGGIDFRLGPLILGIEARYMGVDADLDIGDVNVEGVITTANIGFRF